MATKKYNFSWSALYRSSNKEYLNWKTIRTGAGSGYNTLLGMNSSAVRTAIKTSKTKPKVWINFYVTQKGTFYLGMHKSTTKKASNGIPYYSYTGRAFVPNTGWARYDITNFNLSLPGAGSTFISALDNGYHGPVLYGDKGEPYGIANGAEMGSRPYIEIEGLWNTPPSTSSFTFPGTGQTFDKSIELKWTQATDAEQSASDLRYYISYYDGSKWAETFNRKGILKYNYPLHDKPETTRARFRIRVYDGQAYSGYKYSNYFSVNHNQPPKRPTLTSPVGGAMVGRTKNATFTWRHNDDDGQSKYDFRYKLKSANGWIEHSENTNRQSHTLSGGTLPLGEIEWQVRTYDQGNLVGPWSASAIFIGTEPSNAPIITSPQTNEIINHGNFTVEWSAADQVEYEVILKQESTTVKTWTGTGNRKIITENNILENDQSYNVRVRINTTGGLFSPWFLISFRTEFTPPAPPEMTLREEKDEAAILMRIYNHSIEGTPDVERNIIERRARDGKWIVLNSDTRPGEDFMDYTPASGVVYEYRVTAVAENGTSATGPPEIASLNMLNSTINSTTDKSIMVKMVYDPVRSFSTDYNVSKKSFAGRTKPTAEFGEVIEVEASLQYLLHKDDLKVLMSIVEEQRAVLYRDLRGRKMFAVVTNIDVNDDIKILDMQPVSFSLFEIDYMEGETDKVGDEER